MLNKIRLFLSLKYYWLECKRKDKKAGCIITVIAKVQARHIVDAKMIAWSVFRHNGIRLCDIHQAPEDHPEYKNYFAIENK